jgi:hypothetical protein
MTIVQTGHEVEVRFDRPGVYQLISDIDDHLARGQRSSFTVNQQRPSMFGMARSGVAEPASSTTPLRVKSGCRGVPVDVDHQIGFGVRVHTHLAIITNLREHRIRCDITRVVVDVGCQRLRDPTREHRQIARP